MKKLLTLVVFSLIIGNLFGQIAPPQAICYQAVATDADGRELMGDDLSVRTSIIQNSPTGALIYEEVFNGIVTDNFGLFSIEIGTGTQTGGAASEFANIPWGIEKYFLKVEIDLANGTNFVEMGTSQILSVPYALYAGNAREAETALVAESAMFADSAAIAATAADDFDRDSLNEIQTLEYENDILTLTSPSGNSSSIDFGSYLFRGAGASFDYPQGILGQHVTSLMGIFNVPQGMNFYLTASEENINFSHPDANGGSLTSHSPTPNMPVFPEGTSITNCRCTGFLVPHDAYIEPVIIDLSENSDSYTVPSGKILFIKSGLMNDASGYINVDGLDVEFFRPNLSRWTRVLTFPAGVSIQKPNSPADMDKFVLTGYLIEE